ncbi:MAG: DUF72 domain-containing protein [Actinomycetota bacterium]
MIRLGMSGFSYPEWIGKIYPPGTKRARMLSAYAEIFDAVEINMSFRRTPEESTVDRWRDAVPETFRFTMKANQLITHWRRLVDVGDALSEFVERAGRLGERLGAILFQVPATLKFDAAVIDSFGSSLPLGYAYAFEPRDGSFLTHEATALFRKHGIALCLNDDLFDPTTYTTTAPIAYFRFHRDGYSADDINQRVSLLRRLAEEGTSVYAFYAHENNPDSVEPALQTLELLRGVGV